MGPSQAQADLDLLRGELKERVADLEPLILALEQSRKSGKPAIEAIHLILRHAHSIKGSLAMAEQSLSSQCVHAMESAFVSLRGGRVELSGTVLDLAFSTLDMLTSFADSGVEDEAGILLLTDAWSRLQEGSALTSDRALAGLPFPLAASEPEKLRAAHEAGQKLYLIEKAILAACTREEYEGLPIYEDIAGLGTLVARRPELETIDRSQREVVLLLLVASALPVHALKNQIYDPVREVELSAADHALHLAAPPPRAVARGIRSLLVEDDFTSRLFLQKVLAPYGEAHLAADGEEAVVALRLAMASSQPYDLICLDIMMPKLDGQAVLHILRRLEEDHGIPLGKGTKVVMTTALKDHHSIMGAFREQCDAYVVKPIERARLLEQLRRLGFNLA